MRFVGSVPTRRGMLPACRVRPGAPVSDVEVGEVVAVEAMGAWRAAKVVEAGVDVVRVRYATQGAASQASRAAGGIPAVARDRTPVFYAAVPVSLVRRVAEAL